MPKNKKQNKTVSGNNSQEASSHSHNVVTGIKAIVWQAALYLSHRVESGMLVSQQHRYLLGPGVVRVNNEGGFSQFVKFGKVRKHNNVKD